MGVEKFVPSPESLFSLGFEGGSLGYPANFAGMSRTLGFSKKFVQKKVVLTFRALTKAVWNTVSLLDMVNINSGRA